tara:strand:- start:6602 stop:7489 length:888 start_codon:yes stop_codon:yes gene_type:complete
MELKKICRLCNNELELYNFNKHSGTKDKLDNRCKECVKKIKTKNTEPKVYEIFDLDLNNIDWQVGKVAGTILERNNEKFEVRIKINDKIKSKSFAFSKYKSKDEAKETAIQYQIDISNKYNLTRNRIKIIDNNTIEVELNNNLIMKTDIQFSDLCQKYTICSGKGGGVNYETNDYYAVISLNNKTVLFHKYITNYNMTDHDNRNTLDNRLSNLKDTTHKLNNNNRGTIKAKRNDKEHILGIRFIEKDNSWQARIKQNNNERTKSFSVKKFGYDEAKRLAIETRKLFNELYNCKNS